MRILCPTMLLLVAVAPAGAAEVTLKTTRFQAAIDQGRLAGLQDAAGRTLIAADSAGPGITLHRVAGEESGRAAEGRQTLSAGTCDHRYGSFSSADAAVTATYGIEPDSGDLTIRQQARGSREGLWGVSWSTGRIGRQYAIIVPGHSGLRLSADSPGTRHVFDWPMGWEAQLVIVEGPDHGFYVWADDARGRFKRLIVERNSAGWQLRFVSINDAPFDPLTACDSVSWHVNTYQGDWRVPARRYRTWMHRQFGPVPVAAQQPAWVKDIRACIILPLSPGLLEQLPQRFDPPQTLLYVPDWRQAGYDRDYPDYDAWRPALEPLVARARQLGFRVMLHVNYFGVDPLHAAYRQFEPYHVRSPWGRHEHQWWLWERATPAIRFAYINPASKAWRQHFTAAMTGLCRRLPIDALHLDQTLCIYNDHNGRIDGMSMIEGNVALHRELREALPEVALSGEGLNEMTCRYEAFAQRHAWGLHHAEGTWSRGQLRCAHPIASYLLRPYTVIYGYLGYVSPAADQLYAAWNEAYEHWDVIPTWRPGRDELKTPRGFSRQLFDEVAFWQQEHPEADWDGPWPADVAVPYRTRRGETAARTVDGQLRCGARRVSWTVRDSNAVTTDGTIDGWRAYDDRRLLGLDPQRWYACLDGPRDAEAFHVAAVPDGAVVTEALARPEWAVVGLRPAPRVLEDLVAALERAECGSRPAEGPGLQASGGLQGEDGSQFIATGDRLAAHPPYKRLPPGAARSTTAAAPAPRDGSAYARFRVALPAEGSAHFESDVALDKGATGPGRSDGVLFGVTARAGERTLHAELLADREEPQPLKLDLTGLAGATVELELSVHPGPKRHVSFDWARWHRPQVIHHSRAEGPVAVAGAGGWRTAIGRQGPLPLTVQGNRHLVHAELPARLLFFKQEPPRVSLPLDLRAQTPLVAYISDAGLELQPIGMPPVHRSQARVGGAARPAWGAHPPDHGRTILLFPLTLPGGPAWLHTAMGIGDGSTSSGVVFRVAMNGQELARHRLLPGTWQAIAVDLSQWSGRAGVLMLTTDSDGPFSFDWAHWAEPRITAGPEAPPSD